MSTESNVLVLKKDQQTYEPVLKEHISLAQIAYDVSKKIIDPGTAKDAVDFLLKIKEKRRTWETMVRPVIQSAHEAHKKANALFKEIDQPLRRAEIEILKPALEKYDLDQERKRKDEEDRINRIVREEAEKKQKAEEEKNKNNSLVNPQGQPVPPPTPPPAVVPTIVIPKEQKPEGVSYVDNWTAEVHDLKSLAAAAVAGTIPMDVLMANKSYINQSAKALKGHMNWPGVIVKKERGVRITKRRD